MEKFLPNLDYDGKIENSYPGLSINYCGVKQFQKRLSDINNSKFIIKYLLQSQLK